MKEIPVILGQRGRTTIPLVLREKLGWQAGDTLLFEQQGDAVVIRKPCVSRRRSREAAPQVLILLFGGGGDG